MVTTLLLSLYLTGAVASALLYTRSLLGIDEESPHYEQYQALRSVLRPSTMAFGLAAMAIAFSVAWPVILLTIRLVRKDASAFRDRISEEMLRQLGDDLDASSDLQAQLVEVPTCLPECHRCASELTDPHQVNLVALCPTCVASNDRGYRARSGAEARDGLSSLLDEQHEGHTRSEAEDEGEKGGGEAHERSRSSRARHPSEA
jgi:hypothetical protein